MAALAVGSKPVHSVTCGRYGNHVFSTSVRFTLCKSASVGLGYQSFYQTEHVDLHKWHLYQKLFIVYSDSPRYPAWCTVGERMNWQNLRVVILVST